MKAQSYLITIIVPVFNVEGYVGKCIDSLLSQTYKNLEIIVVNDGSTDGSADICMQKARADSRVIYIEKENGGSASAREQGVKEASGDYIMFVDGDDWIDDNTVESCLKAVQRYPNVECVLFSYAKEYDDHSVSMHLFDKSMHMKNRGLEYKVYRRLFGLTSKELSHPEKMETMASCCMKLYAADCVKKGRYFDIKDIGSSEDALFNMYALYGIREAVYIDYCFYHYVKRGNTQTTTYRPNLRKQWGNLFHIMNEIIEEKKLDYTYKEALSNRVALSITAVALNEIANKKHTVLEHIKEIDSYLLNDKYRAHCRCIHIENMPIVWKAYMICAKLKLSVLIYFMTRAMVILRKRV